MKYYKFYSTIINIFIIKNKKIKFLIIYFLSDVGYRIIKLNEDEIAVVENKKVLLIIINNYEILHEINCDNMNFCILKLSNNIFLTGDEKGTITQYKIENKKINKESSKYNAHENIIYSMTIINNMIISGGKNSNDIKLWKK